ncbi:DUF6199 family natural product biosynthesis protein [Paenibacillus glycanilyticus]|uniref:DUF6199 domain-containing protein n=1 Tax=Paenibacillus glycanilyticus TaxID=126569 RepID=A0ABQ6GFC3_9BACL|nr:hypothetical protein MU1_40060 [Paenibacillus glycanilyticus]
MFGYVLLGLCLIAFGIFMIKKPDVIWEINASWTTRDGSEPSDLYVLYIRIFGGLLIFIGAFCSLFIIFS